MGPEFQRRRSNRPGNSQAKGPQGDDILESKPIPPGGGGVGFTEGVSAEVSNGPASNLSGSVTGGARLAV